MYRKVLVAADGKEDAIRLAEVARELCAGHPGSRVTVLHVLPPPVPPNLHNPFVPAVGVGDDVLLLGEANARKELEEARQLLAEAGIEADTDVAVGAPGEEICRYAQNGGYELIIIGRRGLGRLQEVLLGSVSEYVLRHIRLPVLIVQQPKEAPARQAAG
ncbi:universal stress protein [Hydrogenibacillus sp. N12]|uniref:universal stress protein n=1 Tax=Hydrogenibacillus sp. N12 TaxID=2866627 RepID=UPI001C7D259E|nr:universal stress protein [Hydrogenibacillus sp. N12]QZA32163.1 universal stress protein [Hydrogenibacillus sp. N12]